MTTTTETKTHAMLRKEMRALIAALTASNHNVETFDDGDEERQAFNGDVETLLGCDEVYLFVRCPDDKLRTIYCVFGNNPGELAADYSENAALDAIITAASDAAERNAI
jgi:hypothetical protein